MNKIITSLTVGIIMTLGGVLMAQPAAFDFPAGCTQPSTLQGEGIVFKVAAQVAGTNAELGGVDYIAIFNGNNEIIGRSALTDGFFNGQANFSVANMVVRELPTNNNCPTYTDASNVQVRFYDASADEIIIASNSDFVAVKAGTEIEGPDEDVALRDLFNFIPGSLPVSLVDFKATPVDGRVYLNWATSQETDNSHFEIERSTNGETGFVNIGKVVGNNTTESFNSYEFEDAQPANGMNYYRLRQVDFAGDFTYSPVVAVEMEVSGERELSVFPNPAASNGRLTVNLAGDWATGATEMRLVDAAGRMVAEWKNVTAGSLNTELPRLAAGMYQLIASDDNDRRAVRLIVR